MKEENITVKVSCPGIEDFSRLYPQYASYAHKTGKELFAFLTTPEIILKEISATQMGLVPVAGIAEDIISFCRENFDAAPSTYIKQFVGAVICVVMTSNKFKKTGKKKSVGHPAFSKGELYVRSHSK